MSFLRRPLVVACSVIGTAGLGTYVIKSYMGGNRYEGTEMLDGKVFIVTGANSGIGRATATELAKRKARVIMACRDMTKCQEARRSIILSTKNRHVVCRECDLASFQSIVDFAAKVIATEPGVNVLINNAGIMRCPRGVTKDGIETQLGVNHFGHFLLTMLLLDKLKEHPHSRVVNLTSAAHLRGCLNFDDLNSENNYDRGVAYSQSKLANVLFTKELVRQEPQVQTFAVNPGFVYTNIMQYMPVYNSFWGFPVRAGFWMFSKYDWQGAQTVLYAALSPNLEKDHNGAYFDDCQEKEPAEQAKDEKVAARLWLTSEKWTRLEEFKKILKERVKAFKDAESTGGKPLETKAK